VSKEEDGNSELTLKVYSLNLMILFLLKVHSIELLLSVSSFLIKSSSSPLFQLISPKIVILNLMSLPQMEN
jgi:hypothetical protein